MKKLTTLILIGMLCGTVWGQTRVPENSSSPIYYKDGKVGVGTTNPNAKLSVEGGNVYVGDKVSSNGNRRELRVYGFDNGEKFYGSFHANYDENRRTFDLSSNNHVQQIKIDASGNSYGRILLMPGANIGVGIGTVNPYSKLTVAQSTYDNGLSIHDPVGRKIHLYGSGASGRQILATEGTINPFCIDLNGTELFRIESNGEVGIGTTTPDATLDVAGNIKAHEIEVTLASIDDMQLNGTLAANNITYTANGNTADFVFEDNYQLKDLTEVEVFIKANKHLPEIPSAAEMEEAGVNLAEMNKLLLMKVEELTLYSIEQEKKIEKLTEDRRQETEENNEKVKGLEFKVEELSEERRAMRWRN